MLAIAMIDWITPPSGVGQEEHIRGVTDFSIKEGAYWILTKGAVYTIPLHAVSRVTFVDEE